ncbi:MAG: alpha/beta hydrolase fold domain-containing protein [Segetibacter sp.]
MRENTSAYKIDTAKIGVMGFSAGGHLASSLKTHYNEVVISNPRKTSQRPNFMVLLYPVISFKNTLTHKGSKDDLIRKTPAAEPVHRFSNEEQITPFFSACCRR